MKKLAILILVIATVFAFTSCSDNTYTRKEPHLGSWIDVEHFTRMNISMNTIAFYIYDYDGLCRFDRAFSYQTDGSGYYLPLFGSSNEESLKITSIDSNSILVERGESIFHFIKMTEESSVPMINYFTDSWYNLQAVYDAYNSDYDRVVTYYEYEVINISSYSNTVTRSIETYFDPGNSGWWNTNLEYDSTAGTVTYNYYFLNRCEESNLILKDSYGMYSSHSFAIYNPIQTYSIPYSNTGFKMIFDGKVYSEKQETMIQDQDPSLLKKYYETL